MTGKQRGISSRMALRSTDRAVANRRKTDTFIDPTLHARSIGRIEITGKIDVVQILVDFREKSEKKMQNILQVAGPRHRKWPSAVPRLVKYFAFLDKKMPGKSVKPTNIARNLLKMHSSTQLCTPDRSDASK